MKIGLENGFFSAQAQIFQANWEKDLYIIPIV